MANVGVTSHLARVDLASQQVTVLTEGDHSLQGWQFVASADRHVFQVDEPTRFGDVWTLPSQPGAVMTRVTGVFDHVEREFRIPRQARVTWKGRDGVAVEGLVHYPLDYTEGRRYPLVVNTHGGPAVSDKFGFNGWTSYVQVLAAHGYAVFRPNYRGSTGYGDAFLRDMVGHYFNEAHHDELLGVDHLIVQLGQAVDFFASTAGVDAVDIGFPVAEEDGFHTGFRLRRRVCFGLSKLDEQEHEEGG